MSKNNSENFIQIRSKEQLWSQYVVEGLKAGQNKDTIRANLVEVIRKEVFDQMMGRMKVDDLRAAPQTESNMRIVESISTNTRKKVVALAKMCDRYKETSGIISSDFLQLIFPEEEEEEDDDDFVQEDDEEDT